MLRRYSSILATVGAGFVGSHIVDRLLNNGSVTAIDNLSTSRLENVINHQGKNRGDIRDFIDAQDAVDANMLGLAKERLTKRSTSSQESLPR